jgi:hypothetical protein
VPAIVELRLRPSRPIQPATRQLHGLACAVFEGGQLAQGCGKVKRSCRWPSAGAQVLAFPLVCGVFCRSGGLRVASVTVRPVTVGVSRNASRLALAGLPCRISPRGAETGLEDQ